MKKTISFVALIAVSLLFMANSSYNNSDWKNNPIRMIWQVHWFTSNEQMAVFSASGANTIHSFGTASQSDANIQTYLDRAHENNLKVVMYLGYFIEGTNPDYTWNEVEAHAVMNKWKDHPALFGWHSMDEISNPHHEYSKSFQQSVYNSLKANDSQHPVMITFNGTKQEDWTNYFNETSFDLLDLHAYPNGRAGFWRPEAVLDLFQENHTRNDYPIMGTLRSYQADDWINLENGDVLAQADLLIENHINNIGFYGWYLQASNGYHGLNTHANLYVELEHSIVKMNAAIIRADVNQQDGITTTDAMLTLRNASGLNMSKTNWKASSTTGDVNCDGEVNNTDANLILSHSLGLDISETEWCQKAP